MSQAAVLLVGWPPAPLVLPVLASAAIGVATSLAGGLIAARRTEGISEEVLSNG